MKKTLVSLLCAVVLWSGGMVGATRAWASEISHRIHETQERLDRAVAAGALSRYRTYRLQRSLDKIRYKYQVMEPKGISHSEHERFEHALDELDRAIPRVRR